MVKDQIQNTLINSASALLYKSYQPIQFKDRLHEYLNSESRTFTNEYAKYSSDYVEAEVQGLNPNEPYEYTKVHLRFANIVKASGALSTQFDNYKHILIAERQYDYIRRGAKVKAMGNTWLVINTSNYSDGGHAIIQRCDAVWNYLDYYGNVCSEPMCIDNLLERANTPDSQRSTMITKGYFNAIVQYNDATKQLFENSRMILGSGAYILTGFSDFLREWTDDEDSVTMMKFSLRYDEPNLAIDDMGNKVAGGKTFAWDISIFGSPTLTKGEEMTFTAQSVRTSGNETETVESTTDHPIDYVWESSDENIISVDESGNVTAISEGEAVITAILAQNHNAAQEFRITVASADNAPHVAFSATYPEELPYNRSVLFNALYYENGEATDEPVEWSVTGANEESYTFAVSDEDPNTAVLTCWGGSVKPVVITAAYENHSASHTIYLMGF